MRISFPSFETMLDPGKKNQHLNMTEISLIEGLDIEIP